MTDNKLDTVAVIGLGAMGSGIAQVSILGGIKTLVYDENMDALQTGLHNIVESINKGWDQFIAVFLQRTQGDFRLVEFFSFILVVDVAFDCVTLNYSSDVFLIRHDRIYCTRSHFLEGGIEVFFQASRRSHYLA